MYGKIHQGFFDSSINDTDPITRLVFIAAIVLSDQHGRLDMTRQALARRVNLTVEDVDGAIGVLSKPDPLSRSKEHDGCRLVPIDPERAWGWIVVNKAPYRDTADRENERMNARERQARRRERKRHASVTPSHAPSRVSRDTDTDTDTDTKYIDGVSIEDLFSERWARYPKKDGRKEARRHFGATVRAAGDLTRFDRALTNYLEKIRAEGLAEKYIKNGSTFFNNWQDEKWEQPPKSRVAEHRPEGLKGVVL